MTTTTTTLGNISSLQFICVPLFSGGRRSIPRGKYLSTAIPCLTKSSNPCLLEACLSFSLALQCLFRRKHARSQNISIAITEQHVAAFPIHLTPTRYDTFSNCKNAFVNPVSFVSISTVHGNRPRIDSSKTVTSSSK